MYPIRSTLAYALTVASTVALAGCGGDESATTNPDAGSSSDASASADVTEKPLSIVLSFLTTGDGGTSVFVPSSAGAEADATGLQITTRDGTTPVVTDLWLYTLSGSTMQPLTGFTGTTNRKTGRLMLPATIGGAPANLAPADDGRTNGIMTDGNRGSLVQGAFVSAIDGTVQITLAGPPTDPILVVAGIEDQRYAGAAVIKPDGTAGDVPAGVGVPETHRRVIYELDVKPIIEKQCNMVCHNPSGPLTAPLYKMDTRDNLVNDNFALSEQTQDCQAKYTDPVSLASCIQEINKAQYLVEPGAPALSDLLQRARPDEDKNASVTGLVWFGGGTPKSRYNATYGDRRMPSTTFSTAPADWTNQPTYFDLNPADYQTLYDWVAQGAQP